MGFPIWRTKEEAEKYVHETTREIECYGFWNYYVKVKVVVPELVKDNGGYWQDKNNGDPVQDPFGVGKANQKVFHVGDTGYIVLGDGEDFPTHVGLQKIEVE